MKERSAIILGVIGFDCHAVGNRILERIFSEAGFRVINLGVMVSREEFVAAALENNASAILVSSLYGHAAMDCAGLREECDDAGLDGIILYLGGNLSVGRDDFPAMEKMFREMGFDRVFPPEADLQSVVEILRRDCGAAPARPGKQGDNPGN